MEGLEVGLQVRVGVPKLGIKGKEIQSRAEQAPPLRPGKPGGVLRECLAIGSPGDSTPKGAEIILEHTVFS